MISILIITLVSLVAFLLLMGFGLMRDFTRLWINHGLDVYGKHSVNYYSELATTFMVVLIIAIAAMILKGAATTLVAMVTTHDITTFTTALRGTFSPTTELQSPKSHILFLLLNPALKLGAVLSLISGLKHFFIRINKKAGGDCYNEADVFYFSSIGLFFLVAIEILIHIQDVQLANMAGNIAYLLLDKASYILIFLTLEEVRMMRSNKKELIGDIDKYLVTSAIEKNTMISGWKQLLWTYICCLLLALPYFLGLQWVRDDTTLVSIFIIVLCLALLIMKKAFSESWNLMGTVLFSFADTGEIPIINNTTLCNKTRRLVFIGLFVTGALLVAFLIAYPKQMFMLSLIMIFAISLIAFGIVVIYLLATCVAFLIATITKRDTNILPMKNHRVYVGRVLTSIPRAIAVSASVVTLAFLTITRFPKKLICDDIYVNSSVVDTNGNWLYIDNEYDHYVPVLYEELPEFFKRALVYQEDRGFFKQNNALPNVSNWHGISLSGLRGRGGSNINSQLCKNITFIDADGFPRDLSRKLSEMISGYMISLAETPDNIMTMYLNLAAFHGSFAGFRGLEAASLYAFGKPVGQLNQLQQLYLVTTLPRSNHLKWKDTHIAYSDVHKDPTGIVKEILINKAELWYKEGLISKKELNILKHQNLDFTNCRFKSDIPVATRLRIEKNMASPGRHLSYITLENEQAVSRAYNELRNNSVFRKNGAELEVACIVVNVHTGHIIGHYSSGIVDLTEYRDGFPIGSLGKSPIVIQMLEMGVKPDSKLYDGQVKGRKTPKNANHGWSNKYVTFTEALSKSLNAPFVNLQELNLNPKEVFLHNEGSYRKMGIRSEQRHIELSEDTYNYPLGIRQMYVTEVAQLYQTLLNDGVCYPLRDHYTGEVITPTRIYKTPNVDMVKQALSETIKSGTMKAYRTCLPEGRTYYSKTGTTTRQEYGWAILSDGDLLVVSLASYGKLNGASMKLGVQPLWGADTAGLMSVLVYNEIKKGIEKRSYKRQ